MYKRDHSALSKVRLRNLTVITSEPDENRPWYYFGAVPTIRRLSVNVFMLGLLKLLEIELTLCKKKKKEKKSAFPQGSKYDSRCIFHPEYDAIGNFSLSLSNLHRSVHQLEKWGKFAYSKDLMIFYTYFGGYPIIKSKST